MVRLRRPRFMNDSWIRTIASVRFAIPVLFLFAAGMTVGTILESLYGTIYASRTVYHTWWFYLIQISIGASVLLAMLDRLPPKKRLAGFYVVHISLLTIMTGSVITKIWGVDGTIEIQEGEASSQVRLPEDIAYFLDSKKQGVYPLPAVVSETRLDASLALDGGAKLRLKRYLPYAKEEVRWLRDEGVWSSEWELKNDRFEQNLVLVEGGGAGSVADLGPLRVEVVSPELVAAVQEATPGMLILRDHEKARSHKLSKSKPSQVIPGGGLSLQHVVNPKIRIELFVLKTPKGELRFLPKFSPKPITNHLEIAYGAPFSLYDFERYAQGNHVLLAREKTGKILVASGKAGTWSVQELRDGVVALPWMGFRLRLTGDHFGERPTPGFAAATPSKDEEKNMKALLVEIEQGQRREELWITNRESARSEMGLKEAFLGVRQVGLPFQMRLERFKMEMVPGTTDRPASYESFVSVTKPGGKSETVHIYMNHPYKADGYTFYQASYLQGEDGRYHSILSVNKDPGRPVKYAGALLLVLGLILYFLTLHGVIRWE